MFVAGRFFLLLAAVLTGLALAAGPATAANVTVLPEQPSGESCGTVSLSGHIVSGGCHAESESTGTGVVLHAYVPNKVTISACEVALEGRVGTNGEGYVNSVALTAPHSGSVPCTRTPCDEANGSMIPWPFHIRELDVGNEEVEGTFCIRAITGPPGSPGSQCEVHLPVTSLGNHNYELGELINGSPAEAFCENNPPNSEGVHPTLPFPVSIEPHITTTIATEKVELVH